MSIVLKILVVHLNAVDGMILNSQKLVNLITGLKTHPMTIHLMTTLLMIIAPMITRHTTIQIILHTICHIFV